MDDKSSASTLEFQGGDRDVRSKLSKPLPWKWEEDGLTVTRGAAWSGPGCHDGCGVLLYTDKDGKIVKVEGDPENPFNQGRLCVRCLTIPEVTYHKDRLLHPMKRVGKRGENKWQRISWEEAYDTIASNFNQIKQKYGAEAVVFAQGTGRDISPYSTRLAWTFGSPNWTTFLSGIACYVPRINTCFALQGTYSETDLSEYFPDRYDNPNWKVPECILVWGVDPLVSNADGFFGHWIVDCMKRGSKLIVVDPRLTWLASRADVWLQIRPGTDAALAMAMLNVIIQEGLYDKEFVDKWTYGFDKLAERAAQYPVDKVSEITWLSKEKILAAARLFAKSKPATVKWGLAIDMTKEAMPAAHAISSLWAITGNIDVPGGMVPVRAPFNVLTYAPWGGEYLSQEQMDKKAGAKQYPLWSIGAPSAHPDTLIEQMLSGKPYSLKAAWLQTTNPLACTSGDPKRTKAAFETLDFNVVVDLFMTPTAVALADIVLPACTYPERNGIRAIWFYAQPINKVIEPLGECRSDLQINLELGKRLNPEAWPWKDVDEMLSHLVAASGMTVEELREYGAPIYPEYEYRKFEKGKLRPDGQPGFTTPTGRVELYSTFFEHVGLDPLPYFEEPSESPLSTPDVYKEYPLVLTTGSRTYFSFHSEHRQISRLRANMPDPLVEIHPETAAKYGLKDGDWVWIENRMGRARRKVKTTPIIDPRVINAYHGWWLPEKEAASPALFGMWDVNINQLVPWECGRSGFGANFKSLLCKIYKVKEGEM